jgi:hypothetical protein
LWNSDLGGGYDGGRLTLSSDTMFEEMIMQRVGIPLVVVTALL